MGPGSIGPSLSHPSNKNKNLRGPASPPQSTIPPKVLKTPGLVTLDGRTLEGGGQLVRVALTQGEHPLL